MAGSKKQRNILATAFCAAASFVAVAHAQSPTEAPVNQTMTSKVEQVLNGFMPDWQNMPYSQTKPLACYPTQDGQRVRCAARITENANPAAEDYLQIYVAEDNGEFDRARASTDAIAQKQRFVAKDDGTFSFQMKAGAPALKLPRHCTQGLGDANTFAFCAIEIGTHLVIELQVSPHAASTGDVTVGSNGSSDDLDRASDLALAGVATVLDRIITILAPGEH